MVNNYKDRRSVPRYDIRKNNELYAELDFLNGVTAKVDLNNISLFGIGIKCAIQTEYKYFEKEISAYLNQNVSLRFFQKLKDQNQFILCLNGQIKWYEFNNETESTKIGVSFDHIPDKDKNVWKEMITMLF